MKLEVLNQEVSDTMAAIAEDIVKSPKVKAAAGRVRKNSLVLEKLMKAYRKLSIIHHKN